MQLCLIRSTRSVHNEERTLWYRCIYMHKPMYTHMRPPPPPTQTHTLQEWQQIPYMHVVTGGASGAGKPASGRTRRGGEAAPHAEVLHDDPNNLVLL
jgi:hypothetical protein